MNNLTKVFHISPVMHEDIEIFELRIPSSTMRNEDREIPRICVSKSIQDCIKAHPDAFYHLTNNLDENPDSTFSDYENLMAAMTVQLETKRRFLFYKVYTLYVDEKDLLTPKHLFENGLVPDASFTGEYWLMKETVPHKIEYLLIDTVYETFDSEDHFVDYVFDFEVRDSILEGTLLREDVLFFRSRRFGVDLEGSFSKEDVDLLRI